MGLSRKKNKQRGRGLTQSAPLPSLIGIIASDPEDIDDEFKSFLIEDALKKNADINEVYDKKNPLIFLMTDTNTDGESYDYYTEFIDDLSEEGAIFFKGPDGTALHYAAIYEQDEYIKILLKNGAMINEKNSRGETPLFLAAINSNHNLIKGLINAGADPALADNEGRTPLQVAGLNDDDQERIFRTKEELCNGGAMGPQCDEVARFRQQQRNDLQAQLNRMKAMIDILQAREIPNIVIPAVSQGPKFVPEQKRENAISRNDIQEGDDIIVITEENGAEFFYELSTISQWFATKESEGNAKTNPGTGLEIRDQSQVSRWTASFQTGGRSKKTLRNRTKKQQWKRRK
jgi:hypothetical protein